VEFIATRLQEKSFGVLPRCLWPQKRCGDFQIGTGLAQLSDSRVRHLRAVEVQGYQALEFSKFFQPRVRYLGAARSGTRHFWHQRLTSVALVPLSIAVVFLIVSLLGRNHAAVVQILGSSPVAIFMLLFMITSVYHMWLGMQVIIEDYVHDELIKLVVLMCNTFFSVGVGITAIFAILKLSFGL